MNRFEVQLLGGGERKTRAEIKAHLMAEDRQGAGTGPVAFGRTAGKNPFHQIVVLLHGCAIQSGQRSDSGRVYRACRNGSPPKILARIGRPASTRQRLRRGQRVSRLIQCKSAPAKAVVRRKSGVASIGRGSGVSSVYRSRERGPGNCARIPAPAYTFKPGGPVVEGEPNLDVDRRRNHDGNFAERGQASYWWECMRLCRCGDKTGGVVDANPLRQLPLGLLRC